MTPDGVITTIAGTGVAGFSGDGGPATSAELNGPSRASPDNQGNLYFVDSYNNRIRKIDATGTISTFAGNGTANFSGDGGPAILAELQDVADVLADASGNVFIADAGNFRVRKVNSQGIISTVAGSGVDEPQYIYPDSVMPPRQLGGSALEYSLYEPLSLAVDSAGNVFIADAGLEMVLQVDLSGIITDYAGNGPPGYPPLAVGQSATSSGLGQSSSIAMDSHGNLMIALGDEIVVVSPAGLISNIIQTTYPIYYISLNQDIPYYSFGPSIYVSSPNALYAGAAESGTSGDGGPAINALFEDPGPIALDLQGNIYVFDSYEVRKISADGIISHFAGTATYGSDSGDGGPASTASIGYVTGMAVDGAGNVYLDENGNSVRVIDSQGTISTLLTIPGGTGQLGYRGALTPMAVSPSGTIYVQGPYDTNTSCVYSFTQGGTWLGCNPMWDNYLTDPWAIDWSGNFFWVDSGALNKIAADGTTTALSLPQVVSGFSFGQPTNLAVDPSGNAFLLSYSGQLQEITSEGQIFTIARPNSSLPYADGTASQVDLGNVSSLVTDSAANLYFAGPGKVRQLTPGCPAVVQPLFSPWGVVNAATYNISSLAAGELSAIFGANLGPATGEIVPPTSGRFPTAYAGVDVTVNGTPAPLLYVSQSQVNFVVPFEVEGQRGRVLQISYNGIPSDPDGAQEIEASPGIFAIANADSSANSASSPAVSGSYVTIYGTGQGVSNPPETDGTIMGDTLATPVLPVEATIDGQPGTILYAGSAPGLVAGVLQINLSVPTQLLPGQHIVVISVGDRDNSFQQSLLFTR